MVTLQGQENVFLGKFSKIVAAIGCLLQNLLPSAVMTKTEQWLAIAVRMNTIAGSDAGHLVPNVGPVRHLKRLSPERGRPVMIVV